jgi:hypothetical protein
MVQGGSRDWSIFGLSTTIVLTFKRGMYLFGISFAKLSSNDESSSSQSNCGVGNNIRN